VQNGLKNYILYIFVRMGFGVYFIRPNFWKMAKLVQERE